MIGNFPGWGGKTYIVTLVDEIIKTMEDPPSSGRSSAMDTSLVNRFTRDTGASIHICVTNSIGISVSNPSHLSLASAHVRGRNINARSQESFLGKFDGKPPRDSLKFILAVLLGVNLDARLASSKGDVNTGALVGHQGRQGLDLVSTDVSGVSDTSFAGRSMMRMLSSVSIDHLVTSIISLEREVHLQDMGTRFNNLENAMSFLR